MPRMLTADGPNRMAPRPVPVMWEQLPVTDGIFKEEITNTKAPAIARSTSVLRLASMVFRIEKKPARRNGMQITPHATQKPTGRYPSMICMPYATGIIPKENARMVVTINSFFCNLLI